MLSSSCRSCWGANARRPNIVRTLPAMTIAAVKRTRPASQHGLTDFSATGRRKKPADGIPLNRFHEPFPHLALPLARIYLMPRRNLPHSLFSAQRLFRHRRLEDSCELPLVATVDSVQHWRCPPHRAERIPQSAKWQDSPRQSAEASRAKIASHGAIPGRSW